MNVNDHGAGGQRQPTIEQARFETPAAPAGWDRWNVDLIRIVDSLGNAIAWFAPEVGGACIGYAVRRGAHTGETWIHVFDMPLDDDTIPSGCTIQVRLIGENAVVNDGCLVSSKWRLKERDPTAMVLEALLSDGDEPTGRCAPVRLSMTAQLENASLLLTLSAANEGNQSVSVGIGLRLSFWLGAEKAVCVFTEGIGNHQIDKRAQVVIQIARGGVELTPLDGVQHIGRRDTHLKNTVSLEVFGYHPDVCLTEVRPDERTAMTLCLRLRDEL